ncbi:hypothetical protein Esti_004252 [Eimeria stiedai]
MTARVDVVGGPSGAPRGKRNSGSRKSRREPPPLEGPSDGDAAAACSSSEEEAAAKAPEPKRLQLDVALMQRVKKIQQQQQQQQQKRGGLLLLGAAGGGAKQHQRKAQQVQQQQQIHSKLVALRVSMNAALRLSSCFPAAALLQQLQQQQQQQGIAAAAAAVRKEAGTTFVMLRRLQQLLLQQSSLAAAYTAAAADPDPAAAAAAEGEVWRQRRVAYEAEQAAAAPGRREGDVWRLVGDVLFASGLKNACLVNADAWHQQLCSDRTKGFAALNQPVSVQLRSAMLGEDEKLLGRLLRTSHVLWKGKNQEQNELGSRGKSKEHEMQTGCAVVGCEAFKKAGKETQHQYVDDATVRLWRLLFKGLGSGVRVEGFGFVRAAKEVDRRASKGRKIRYKPIPQLENFMAAEPWLPNTDALPGAGDSLVVESLMSNLFRGVS